MTAKPFESTSAATADAFTSIMRAQVCGHAFHGSGPTQAA
jgi:hypothetical protein